MQPASVNAAPQVVHFFPVARELARRVARRCHSWWSSGGSADAASHMFRWLESFIGPRAEPRWPRTQPPLRLPAPSTPLRECDAGVDVEQVSLRLASFHFVGTAFGAWKRTTAHRRSLRSDAARRWLAYELGTHATPDVSGTAAKPSFDMCVAYTVVFYQLGVRPTTSLHVPEAVQRSRRARQRERARERALRLRRDAHHSRDASRAERIPYCPVPLSCFLASRLRWLRRARGDSRRTAVAKPRRRRGCVPAALDEHATALRREALDVVGGDATAASSALVFPPVVATDVPLRRRWKVRFRSKFERAAQRARMILRSDGALQHTPTCSSAPLRICTVPSARSDPCCVGHAEVEPPATRRTPRRRERRKKVAGTSDADDGADRDEACVPTLSRRCSGAPSSNAAQPTSRRPPDLHSLCTGIDTPLLGSGCERDGCAREHTRGFEQMQNASDVAKERVRVERLSSSEATVPTPSRRCSGAPTDGSECDGCSAQHTSCPEPRRNANDVEKGTVRVERLSFRGTRVGPASANACLVNAVEAALLPFTDNTFAVHAWADETRRGAAGRVCGICMGHDIQPGLTELLARLQLRLRFIGVLRESDALRAAALARTELPSDATVRFGTPLQ